MKAQTGGRKKLDNLTNLLYNKEMAISDFLTPDRILFDESSSKEEVMDRLIRTAAEAVPFPTAEMIREKIFERERDVSTNIAPGIAVPHAIFEEMPYSIAVVSVCRGGIEWQTYSSEPVRLILLLLGNRMTHLAVLSEAVQVLHDGENFRAILAACTSREVYNIFTSFDKSPPVPLAEDKADFSRIMYEKGRDIAKTLGGRLILHTDAVTDTDYIVDLVGNTDTIIVTTDPKRFPGSFAEGHSIFEIPFRGARRSVHVRFSMLLLLSSGVLQRDRTVVNVYGVPESGIFDSIRITRTDEQLETGPAMGMYSLADDFSRQVLTRVLQLAGELAREGREGKPVGTLFVVGDHEKVKFYTRQLIINPFHRYDEQQRNIIDPSLEETVKEFAKIDGAFVIREDGVILSCGTFISGVPKEEKLHSGLGARHAAALTISTVTAAFAVVISESTRKISVFHGGKKIVEM